MNVIEAIENRRSVRKFVKGEKISENDILTILTCAMSAPSAMNTRPWEFLVIENDLVKQSLLKISPFCKMIEDAAVVIVIIARPDLQEGKCSNYFPEDCAAATENILLSALELGYGSCWCGVYPNQKRVEDLKLLLNIKKGLPFNMIAIGKSAENPTKKGFYEEEKVRFLK